MLPGVLKINGAVGVVLKGIVAVITGPAKIDGLTTDVKEIKAEIKTVVGDVREIKGWIKGRSVER